MPYVTRYRYPRQALERQTRKQQRSRKVMLVVYGVTFVILGVIGLLVQDVTIGRLFLILYGVVAIVLRIPSADTFKMAIVTMIGIIILAFINDTDLIKNFGEYAFLLLCIGVVCSAVEMRRKSLNPS